MLKIENPVLSTLTTNALILSMYYSKNVLRMKNLTNNVICL